MNTLPDRVFIFLSPLLGICLLCGCSDTNTAKKKIRSVKGVAKTIDVENRSVSVLFTDDKGNERELVGTFREDTVVMINGRNQEIKDIREGDKVIVYGFREGEGSEQKWIATKVVIDRPRSSDWKATGQGKGDSAGQSQQKTD